MNPPYSQAEAFVRKDMEPDDWSVGEMWEAIAFWVEERPCILADRARLEAARLRVRPRVDS